MSLFISDAWAQAAGQQSAEASAFPLLLMVGIFALFYFMMIRPQQKRAKQHRELIATLKKGDEVVTSGGILGRVTEVGENYVTMEVAEEVEIRVQRHAVQNMMPKGTIKSA